MSTTLGTAAASALLGLYFRNEPIADVGDDAGLLGSSVPGSLYIGLHTALPIGDAQTSHEIVDATYARVAVARTSDGWDATLEPDVDDRVAVANADEIAWPQLTSATATVTHVSIGTEPIGTGRLLFVVELDEPLVTAPGQIPKVSAGDLKITIEVNDA